MLVTRLDSHACSSSLRTRLRLRARPEVASDHIPVPVPAARTRFQSRARLRVQPRSQARLRPRARTPHSRSNLRPFSSTFLFSFPRSSMFPSSGPTTHPTTFPSSCPTTHPITSERFLEPLPKYPFLYCIERWGIYLCIHTNCNFFISE